MKIQSPALWSEVNFIFADNKNMSFDIQVSDSVITEISLDAEPPEFRVKHSLDDLFAINALLFVKDVFPYQNLWFKYAQLLSAEKHFKYNPPADTELLRIITFEYLRIAEYLFCLATFSLNSGLNEIYSGIMEQYESLNRFLTLSLAEITPFEIICGIRRMGDLPSGYIEKNLKYLEKFQSRIEYLSTKLLRNRILFERCRNIPQALNQQSLPLSGGPNLRATGILSDRRQDMPYSYYQKLFFDQVEISREKEPYCGIWRRLRVRCEEIFISVHLIRQAIQLLVYEKVANHPTLLFSTVAKGHASSIIETPWSPLACQMNCPGGKEPCEFILTNPLHEIQLLLRQAAIGVNLSDLPLLIASLGLRPKMKII